MRPPLLLPVPIAAALLLAGCTTAPTPTTTVTVTATPPSPSQRSGDGADWDLSAVCAAESEALALSDWREQQVGAGRLSSAQSAAVLQAVAVQYLELGHGPLPESVQQDGSTLTSASGTLAHPTIDLESPAVRKAVAHLVVTCHRAGLTIGVVAQGG